VTDGADFAAADHCHQPRDLRVAAVHEGLHEEHALLSGSFGDGGDFGGVHSRRLFTQHRLAPAHGHDCEFGMPGMWCRNIDGVNVRVSGECFVTGVAFAGSDAVLIAK
jgi:hypothetical protein